MYHPKNQMTSHLWKHLVEQGLKEDGLPWDWTAIGLGLQDSPREICVQVIAKADGVWAGETLCTAVQGMFQDIRFSEVKRDGDLLRAGQTVLKLKGPASEVLGIERTFLNLAGYVSGIATATQKVVNQLKNSELIHKPRITLTRKTLPGYRDVGILGVRVGGGFPHRVNLASGVLIKENHIASAGGIKEAVERASSIAPHGLRIECEVRNENELNQAIDAGVDIVMLDNFSPTAIRSAIKIVREKAKQSENKIWIEVSGGIHEGNILDYAIEGVDIISMGSLTHSVKVLDLSLLHEDVR